MKIYERLKAENPTRNICFTAVEQLTEETEMREFFAQYIEALAAAGHGREVAAGNIGYVVGYYSPETAERWMRVIPEVSHPIFGRDIPWTAGAKT
jgi:hypothetical protein